MRQLLVLAALLLPLSVATAAENKRQEDAGLRYTVPMDWNRVPAPSDMRAAQFEIPAAEGGAPAELILFFFGEGKGGSPEQNLERWYAQFTQPDGSPSKDAAVVTIRTVKGMKVTAVDLSGTFAARGMGGPSPAEKTDQQMLAAIVEGEGGPWFFKMVGDQATIGAAKPGFDAMLTSLEAHR